MKKLISFNFEDSSTEITIATGQGEENKLFWDRENRATFGPGNPIQLTGTIME